MRKLIFICFVVFGAAIGLLSAADDDWATRIVMMAVGVIFGAPVGAALGRWGEKQRRAPEWDEDLRAGTTTAPRSLATNYWRDKGHPPFAKPQEAEPDRHMFDPDKLG